MNLFQVTENTAIVLDRQGFLTQYRGKTFVKGVDYVGTYFVPLDEDFNLINKETFINKTKIDEDNEEDDVMMTKL